MFKINQTYYNNIINFCEINNIDDVDLFINQCLKQGFDVKKYGLMGEFEGFKDESVEPIIIEKPVEIIKEIEKIVEVPVEVKVIEYVDREVVKEVLVEVPKEKIVTKIEYISDKESENELLLKIQQLETELSNKDESLDELRRNLDEVLDKPPVEIIKEVEVVKEVEVIKEITPDNTKLKMLETTLQNLRKEITSKNSVINELTEKNKLMESQLNNKNAIYLKGSNLNDKLYGD